MGATPTRVENICEALRPAQDLNRVTDILRDWGFVVRKRDPGRQYITGLRRIEDGTLNHSEKITVTQPLRANGQPMLHNGKPWWLVDLWSSYDTRENP